MSYDQKHWNIHPTSKEALGSVSATELLYLFSRFSRYRHCARVVNGIALKATGLRPRKFESCQCRTFFVFLTVFLYLSIASDLAVNCQLQTFFIIYCYCL
jgi:uncharacterized membrane protein